MTVHISHGCPTSLAMQPVHWLCSGTLSSCPTTPHRASTRARARDMAMARAMTARDRARPGQWLRLVVVGKPDSVPNWLIALTRKTAHFAHIFKFLLLA